jgi:copper ion binding protein
LILNIYIRKYVSYRKSKITGDSKFNELSANYYSFRVKGLDCETCKINVEKALSNISDMESIDADIKTSIVKIRTKKFQANEIQKTIESIGLTYNGLVNETKQITPVINYKIVVKGMNCNHCKMNVENVLHTIPGISSVKVELDQSSATFEGNDLDMNEIKKSIESVGYEYGGLIG